MRRAASAIVVGLLLGTVYFEWPHIWPRISSMFTEDCRPRRLKAVEAYLRRCQETAPHLTYWDCLRSAEASEPECM